MKFDKENTLRKNNFVYQINFYIFSILILLLSPNYLMQLFPFFKLIWGGCLVFFLFFFVIHFKGVKLNKPSICLFLFYSFLFICSFFGFVRYDNQDGIYFSLGMFAKFLLVYLFLMSFNYFYFIKIIKNLIIVFFILCMHSLLGWLLFLTSMIHVTDVIELSTYYYNVMSIWGVYTVSFPVGSIELIRNQSFFQEPGAFAFYIFVIMVILVLMKDFFKKKYYNLIYFFIFLTMLTTFSATGIILSILLSLFVFKSKFLNIIFSTICIFVLSYIIFSDNPYVNKVGSFEERLYGITKGVEVFYRDPMILLIGAGYNSEYYLGFDGKFNNFVLEIVLYSGLLGLFVYLFFLLSLHGFSKNIKIFYFLILIFCFTTPFFWSPIILIFNLFVLRFFETGSVKKVN